MKLRLMPLVASLCGMFLCVSVAQANSVYIHNKPVANVVTINHTVYVPFADLMDGLHRNWSVDAQGNVVMKRTGEKAVLNNPNFTLVNGDKSINVAGVMRAGQVWVPVRIVRDLGCELIYNAQTEIVDIITPRLISDADRQAEAEVASARAEREAALAEQQAAEKAALEERKQALADLKAKKAKGATSKTTDSSAEGTYDPNFEAEQLAAAKKVEATQKNVGDIETYSDLMKVQAQLDEQDAARRAAYRKARKEAAGESEEAQGAATEKAAPTPAPNLVVFTPRATPDYFTGHINMTAVVRNLGNEAAKGVTATVSLIAPDGSVLNTQRMRNNSVDVNGQWVISTGYDHLAGAEMPRGVYQLRVNVDFANKATK